MGDEFKARLVRSVKRKSERQLSVFRSFDFQDCLVLLFDPEYDVRSATLVPTEIVQAHARFRQHVNGSVFFATEEILKLGTDLTQRFR